MSDSSSYRKAAILISALDTETADLLLAEMPDDVAKAIREEVLELSDVNPDEQQAIVEEFLRLGSLAPEVNPPGLELTDELAERLTNSEFQHENNESADFSSFSSHSNRDFASVPLQSLRMVDVGTLASVLEAEPPQIISLVVANLPAHYAGDVLARLPSVIQAEVIRRLTGLEQVNREVLDEIEQLVMTRIHKIKPVSNQTSGLATVSTILNSADEAARRQILLNLARHDRPLAGKLKPPAAFTSQFTFDDVCRLDVDGLLRVVRSAPPETAVLAFAGADAELVQELVECLPADESQRFARGIIELGPTRLADIEAAQASLADLASQLSADGRLHGGPPIHLTAVA